MDCTKYSDKYSGGINANKNYYEAWKVSGGSASSGDQFTLGGLSNGIYTTGSWIGTAKYFDSESAATSSSDWGSTIGAANGLPSTSFTPSWWGNGIGMATHTLNFVWE